MNQLKIVRLLCCATFTMAFMLVEPWGRAGASVHAAEKTLAPLYKPSSRAPAALDIRDPSYGASRTAPNALTIGDQVPDFVLPKAGGGVASLEALRERGDVVIVFYRGHW